MKLTITKIDMEKQVNTNITEIINMDFNDEEEAKLAFDKTVESMSLYLSMVVNTPNTVLLAELDANITATGYRSFYEVKLV